MNQKNKPDKPWGGRFSAAMDALMESFSTSIHFDYKLYPYDIAGSIAHARMLGRQGLVSPDEAAAMVKGLQEIKAEIDRGQFQWNPALEDVHMNIEHALTEKIGQAGEKLHTARSRNDQVALDTRLYLKDAIRHIQDGLKNLRLALVRQGDAHRELLMPGYTHLQRAQPIPLAHHLLAYNEMFSRDQARLTDLYPRVDVLVLGAAALAGTGLPVDMAYVAGELGFSKITANSLDAVSDRDYILEFLAAAAITMTHLSRLSEDLILWASKEFGFIRLPDELSTGSSIMPQKKNPDVPELVRGKTGRIYGHLVSLLTTMKGLPLSYNRDLQEDKEPLFDTVETLSQVLAIMALLISRLEFNRENMRKAADDPFVTATDLADHLVRQGVPFRQAHAQVGALVRHLEQNGLSLSDIDETELARFCPRIKPGVKRELTLEASVAARITPGGAAPARVISELEKALKELES